MQLIACHRTVRQFFFVFEDSEEIDFTQANHRSDVTRWPRMQHSPQCILLITFVQDTVVDPSTTYTPYFEQAPDGSQEANVGVGFRSCPVQFVACRYERLRLKEPLLGLQQGQQAPVMGLLVPHCQPPRCPRASKTLLISTILH